MSYTTSSTTAGPLGLSASLLNRYIHPPFTHKFDRSFISTLTACIENHKYRNYQELEGKFSKWNNNAGSVRAHRGGAAAAPLQHNMLDIIGRIMIQATKATAVEAKAVSANAAAVRAGKELAVREGALGGSCF